MFSITRTFTYTSFSVTLEFKMRDIFSKKPGIKIYAGEIRQQPICMPYLGFRHDKSTGDL